ncbi:hypothetical protein [Romboutsia ilealis]|uniref:hypothetical protein n=1 Tax=Romboutsia ilealis TaxID=1115758 RepID=UPI0026F3B495|nr:hypothetical protein [Romboutsia ilealis]
MQEIVRELLPYAKVYAEFYLIGNIIMGVFVFGFFIYVFGSIIKSHKKFKL